MPKRDIRGITTRDLPTEKCSRQVILFCWRTKEIRIGKEEREMLNIQDLTLLWTFQRKEIVH